MQFLVHYSLHFIFPAIVAYSFFRKNWVKVYLILLSTMLIDLDHLLANPIFEADRCSIGFHPLHSFFAIVLYVLLLFYPKKIIKIIALGLVLHIFTDLLDCFWTFSHCHDCFMASKIHDLFSFLNF
ncbi:DUF6122 family protein [Pedobacter segetis]|uniref:DUF6122 family protein n=1 Tax=Pedobacter segetis TaxID=2793069 RepID=UPI001F2909E3|nr:DUF6122 family protein [Pedobacter segetis]